MEHQHHRGPRAVIRCVHSEFDSDDDASLASAVFGRDGGTFVRCCPSSPTLAHPGPLNGPLARHLESIARARGIELEVSEVGGFIQASVGGNTDPLSAEATLARVAEFLCSDSLRSSLVGYSYSTDELDERHAALLWDLPSEAALLAPTPLDTLVVIACGWVQVPKHCDSLTNAVRFVVRENELIRRQPRREPDTRVNKVLPTADEPIVLFLGAGASASCKIPQGNTLRDQAIANLTSVSGSSEEMVEAFRQYLEDRPQRFMVGERDLTDTQFARSLTLERVLREEFHEIAGRPRSEAETVKSLVRYCGEALHWMPPGRQALRELMSLLPRLVVATVNFDELIEDGLTLPHEVVASVHDFATVHDLVAARITGTASVLPILKIHGTIADPETIVADIDATARGLPREIEVLLDVITSSCGRVTWVWAGCSMRDLDLGVWLRRQPTASITEFWVDPLPPASVADYARDVRAQDWAANNVTLDDRQITESVDVFLPALLERARVIAPSTV